MGNRCHKPLQSFDEDFVEKVRDEEVPCWDRPEPISAESSELEVPDFEKKWRQKWFEVKALPDFFKNFNQIYKPNRVIISH
jgi:hypothetical protein